jgi:hypothetical protein
MTFFNRFYGDIGCMKDISEYIRVTSVLYPFSGLSKVDPEVLRKAAERGSQVHAICDAMIGQMGIDRIDPSLEGYIESFKKWLPKVFLDKPPRFFCDTYGLTGECDAIYEDENGLVLVDFKTPVKEGKTWPLQTSAYAYLARLAGYDIQRVEAVKLCKNGNAATVYTYEEDMDTFLSCLDLYKRFFRQKEEENIIDLL